MSTAQTTLMTAEEFWQWASRPEKQDRLYELDRGRVVEVPSPGGIHGLLCAWLAHLLWTYVLRRGAGAVVSNDTGLLVARDPDTVRGPDLMLFLESRRLEDVSPKFIEEVPQLIVEVLSPSDRAGKISLRIGQYLARGIPLVWLVDPEDRTVTVYRPNELPRVLDEQDELNGNGVLADFALKVADLFRLPGAPAASEAPA